METAVAEAPRLPPLPHVRAPPAAIRAPVRVEAVLLPRPTVRAVGMVGTEAVHAPPLAEGQGVALRPAPVEGDVP